MGHRPPVSDPFRIACSSPIVQDNRLRNCEIVQHNPYVPEFFRAQQPAVYDKVSALPRDQCSARNGRRCDTATRRNESLYGKNLEEISSLVMWQGPREDKKNRDNFPTQASVLCPRWPQAHVDVTSSACVVCMSLNNKAKRDLRQYFSNIMYLVSGRTGTLEASCRYSGRTKTALRTTSTVMIEYGPVERKSTRDK